MARIFFLHTRTWTLNNADVADFFQTLEMAADGVDFLFTYKSLDAE